MKKLLLLVIAFLSINTYAQDVDSIIKDYISAIGGQAKLDKVKSISKTMTMKTSGMEIPMESYQDVNGVIYTKMSMMGTDMVAVAFDGKQGYKLNQSMGYDAITDAEKPQIISQAKSLFGSLVNYKEAGNKLEYLGTEKVDGVDYYALKLTQKEPAQGGATEMKILINPNTHLIAQIIIETQGMTIIRKLSDYKEYDGIKFPVKTEVMMGSDVLQTITITNVKLNAPKPDASVFVQPKE